MFPSEISNVVQYKTAFHKFSIECGNKVNYICPQNIQSKLHLQGNIPNITPVARIDVMVEWQSSFYEYVGSTLELST